MSLKCTHHVQADLEGSFTVCQYKWLPLSSHTCYTFCSEFSLWNRSM